MKHFISLGAGVQSSTMALMAKHGEITPMPDGAIFADTQDEPREVYEWLHWLERELPFEVWHVTRGKLSRRLLQGDNGARMPFFIKAGGIAKRQCTRDYKIRPIRRKLRYLLGVGEHGYLAPESACQWVGISLDEIFRMKPSDVKWIVNRHPLVELRMSRRDCINWLWDKYRKVAPKSACKQCPYQEPERLLHLKETDPAGFDELLDFDKALREPEQVRRFRGELYVHSSCQPLVQINLEAEIERRGPDPRQINMFINECEGMCGV